MNQKVLFSLIFMFFASPFMNSALAQEGIVVMLTDTDPVTNVRSAPHGGVVMSLPDTCAYMLGVTDPRDGWWRVDWVENAEVDEEDADVALQGSPTGEYWIHHSVIGLSTRNYGGLRWCLRSEPNEKSKPTYWFTDEITVHPINVSGDWVQVKTAGHTGWIDRVNLCSNPLTTCP